MYDIVLISNKCTEFYFIFIYKPVSFIKSLGIFPSDSFTLGGNDDIDTAIFCLFPKLYHYHHITTILQPR